MPRQVLTFLFIFVIVMFAMRACTPKDTLPPAITTEKAPDASAVGDSIPLNNGVLLARDGSVLWIKQADARVVMPVASWRRPLQMYVRLEDGEKRIIPSKWKTTETLDGREFTYEEDELKITKRLVPGVGTLTMHVTVVGGGDKIEGLEVDVASGVVLPAAGASEDPGVFRRFSGDKLEFLTLTDLAQRREQRRGDLLKQLRAGNKPKPDYYLRKLLDPGQSIERFGVLGKDHYLMLEQFADDARAVNVDVYRLKRTGTEENQIETWISLNLVNGQYEGTFKLSWGTREELGKIEPPLRKKTETKESKTYRLENDTMRVDLSDRGASLKALWLKNYSLEVGQAQVEKNWLPMIRDAVPVRHRSLSMYADPERYDVRLAQQVWTATRAADGKSIKFTLTTPAGFEFIKVVRLPEEGRYDLAVKVHVKRPESSTDSNVVYTLVGPAGSYIEDSYRGIIGAAPPSALFIERGGGDGDYDYIETIAKEDEPFLHTYEENFARGYLRAVGVRGAFFVCALTTEEWTDSMGRPGGHVTEARVRLLELTRAVERPDGESSRQSLKGQIACLVPFENGEAVSEYRFYAGPNQRSDLKALRIEEAVDFGFFGGIGRLLMWLMKALQSLFGSFGLAIIFMTLIVRAILMPVSYKTQLGMMRYSKRIQKIKPQLEALEKRYGSNRRKMNEERMKVMRENKVGFPLGCLMIFFQIPIWFALFGALRVEFSLRHEPFLWATDLTMPDRLFDLSFWPGAFNLLPILMLVLWVVQQRLAPQPGGDDPNVKMQMKMVRFMPYIFFIFLYKYAAALSVYMCVSSAWGIVEAKFVRKAVKGAETADGL